MAFEATSGLQVMNHYGRRDTGGSAGVERTTKSLNIFSVEFTSAGLLDGFVSPFVMPKHAHMLRAFLTVDAPFGAGLTSVTIGEGPAGATNGITILAADLNVEGWHDVTAQLKGTWAATDNVFTTRASRIAQVIVGTPAVTGRGTLSIEYHFKVRDDTEWEPDPATFPTYPAQA